MSTAACETGWGWRLRAAVVIGAAVACYRLSCGLKNPGIKSVAAIHSSSQVSCGLRDAQFSFELSFRVLSRTAELAELWRRA